MIYYYYILFTKIKTTNLIKTRTGVPELRGPALVCLSAIDKKLA